MLVYPLKQDIQGHILLNIPGNFLSPFVMMHLWWCDVFIRHVAKSGGDINRKSSITNTNR
jgi:hypothetical protein